MELASRGAGRTRTHRDRISAAKNFLRETIPPPALVDFDARNTFERVEAGSCGRGEVESFGRGEIESFGRGEADAELERRRSTLHR